MIRRPRSRPGFQEDSGEPRLQQKALPLPARLFRLGHRSLNSRARYSALLSPETDST